MGDFRTELRIDEGADGSLQGRVMMYADQNMIQDDEIERIEMSTDKLTFYIPAKQTSFEGAFDKQRTALEGNFVFPDGSVHAIQFHRQSRLSSSSEDYMTLRDKDYSGQELRTDLEFLYSNLSDYHPGLYAFTPQDSLNALLDELEDRTDSARSLHDFYLLSSELTDAVGCSHTGIKPSTAYQKLSEEHGNFFPMNLFFEGDKAFFLSMCVDETNNPMAPGSEIISINRIPVGEIIRQLFYLIPSEGNNTTTKYRGLNRHFNELYYYLDDSKEFTVEYSKGDTIESMAVAACRMADLRVHCPNSDRNEQYYFQFMDNGNLGVLTVSSFAIRDLDRYFQDLDSVFNVLGDTKTQNLVLDLRDNEGGHPIFAAQLLSYLTDQEFVYFKRNEDIEEFEPLYNRMQPNGRAFNGNLYVFINGGCLSTTGHLISLLKYYTNALFIGEQPGSTYRCNDFSIQFKLPHTGLEVNVPRTTFETAAGGLERQRAFSLD